MKETNLNIYTQEDIDLVKRQISTIKVGLKTMQGQLICVENILNQIKTNSKNRWLDHKSLGRMQP